MVCLKYHRFISISIYYIFHFYIFFYPKRIMKIRHTFHISISINYVALHIWNYIGLNNMIYILFDRIWLYYGQIKCWISSATKIDPGSESYSILLTNIWFLFWAFFYFFPNPVQYLVQVFFYDFPWTVSVSISNYG